MRHRQTNVRERNKQRVQDLIQSEVLSSSEQDIILTYFANSLRISTMLLRVVACLHGFLAFVYAGLLFSGYLTLSTVLGPKERDAITRLMNAPSFTTDGNTQGKLNSKSHPSPTAAGNSDTARHFLFPPQTSLRKFVEGATATPLGFFCMLTSIFILLLGGYGCWKACLALRLNTAELLHVTLENLREGGKKTSSSVQKSRNELGRRSWDPTRPYFHYAISLCAAVQTLVWAFSTAKSNNATREVYYKIDPSLAPKLWFGITSSFSEIIIIFWQPFFHWFVGSMIQSMFTAREGLISLSKLRYVFEKP